MCPLQIAVQEVLNAADVEFVSVMLGKAVVAQELKPAHKVQVQEGLKHCQLDLTQDKTRVLLKRIKTEIISLLHSHKATQLKLSAYLSHVLNYNYTYLVNTFSEREGKTPESYFHCTTYRAGKGTDGLRRFVAGANFRRLSL